MGPSFRSHIPASGTPGGHNTSKSSHLFLEKGALPDPSIWYTFSDFYSYISAFCLQEESPAVSKDQSLQCTQAMVNPEATGVCIPLTEQNEWLQVILYLWQTFGHFLSWLLKMPVFSWPSVLLLSWKSLERHRVSSPIIRFSHYYFWHIYVFIPSIYKYLLNITAFPEHA